MGISRKKYEKRVRELTLFLLHTFADDLLLDIFGNLVVVGEGHLEGSPTLG